MVSRLPGIRFSIPLLCGAGGFVAAWLWFAPASGKPPGQLAQEAPTKPELVPPPIGAAGPPRLGSAAARVAEIERMAPGRLVEGIKATWGSDDGAIDLFSQERVSWGLRMAEALCRDPHQALAFAASLKPGHSSREAIRGKIFETVGRTAPGDAIAALAALPNQARRAAVFGLNQAIPPGSPHAADLESRLTPAERYERQVSPVASKARQPGLGQEALTEAARLPGLGVLGRAQARQQVLATWMMRQPGEFEDWLAGAEGAAMTEGARQGLLSAFDVHAAADGRTANLRAAHELRRRIESLLTPKAR